MKKEDARFYRIFLFLFFQNANFVGVTPHLTPKKALFLKLCTTLLTSIFGGAIMALESG